MTDHSDRIGVVRGKRTVNVVVYGLLHSPVKDLRNAVVNHVNWQCILHFSIIQISICSKSKLNLLKYSRLEYMKNSTALLRKGSLDNGCVLFQRPGSSRSFSTTGLARARAQPFFFAAPAGPGGPKLARPLSAAVIGHAHLPRFSCFANGIGKRFAR